MVGFMQTIGGQHQRRKEKKAVKVWRFGCCLCGNWNRMLALLLL
jgi:hypothetical protein